MSTWKKPLKPEIVAFRTLKKMFEASAIDRMYDIRDIHPGKIADALGINKGRYASKLAHPETFSVFEILRLSYLINIDPLVILEIIQNEKEVSGKVLTRVNNNISKASFVKKERTKGSDKN